MSPCSDIMFGFRFGIMAGFGLDSKAGLGFDIAVSSDILCVQCVAAAMRNVLHDRDDSKRSTKNDARRRE